MISDINNLENRLGIKIPTRYKEFLLKHNGGQILPNHFYYTDSKDCNLTVSVDNLFGIDEKEPSFDLAHKYIVLSEYIPKGLLPIADDGVGNIICMGIDRSNEGMIYMWWREEKEFVDLIAKGFDEFVNGLTD